MRGKEGTVQGFHSCSHLLPSMSVRTYVQYVVMSVSAVVRYSSRRFGPTYRRVHIEAAVPCSLTQSSVRFYPSSSICRSRRTVRTYIVIHSVCMVMYYVRGRRKEIFFSFEKWVLLDDIARRGEVRDGNKQFQKGSLSLSLFLRRARRKGSDGNSTKPTTKQSKAKQSKQYPSQQ